MKRHCLIGLSVLVAVGVFAGRAAAEEGFKVDVVKCGVAGTPGDCGFFPASPLPLDEGEMRAGANGTVIVDLEGAAPGTTYKVYVGSFFIGGGFVQRYPDGACCSSIGTVTTNAEGRFEGHITTPAKAEFVFPAGTSLAQPSFVFTFIPAEGPEQAVYTTGFSVTSR